MQFDESQGPAQAPQTQTAQVDDAFRPGPAPGPTPAPPSPSQAYLGQIEAFSFNFAPAGWLPCDGRLLPVIQYQALFSLLGLNYGGNGQVFGIPRLEPLGPSGPHYYISLAGAFPPRS